MGKVRWKSVPGYEGLYEASTDGRIRNARGQEIAGRGNIVKLHKEGETIITTVPRVILTTFHGPAPSPRHKAMRLDRNPTNNALKNLAWKTRAEFPPRAVLDAKTVKTIRRLASKGLSIRQIANEVGVARSTVASVANGYTWTAI